MIVSSSEAALPEGLQRRLADAGYVAIVAGAGLSADAGLPTYRGEDGLGGQGWRGADAIDAFSVTTFETMPARTWAAVRALALRARVAQPSAAHLAAVAIRRRVERFIMLTQNVDDLHRRAGCRDAIEVHGHIFDVTCADCCSRSVLSDGPEEGRLPRCPSCGGALRPGIVLYGELLDSHVLERIEHAFYRNVPDVVLVVGTSATFPYITEPLMRAGARGKLIVEINVARSWISPLCHYVLRGPAAVWLPQIVAALDG